ncbi:MAG: hypothetical protein M3083_09380, partial [Actinomycetota bacterium]|nr:hypothetical protein [Actinomycetota bacterium]
MRAYPGRSESFVPAGLVLGVGTGSVVWLMGEMAALFWRGRWPAISPAAVGSILVRLPFTLGKPANAWPPTVRPQLPTEAWWYVASGAVSLVAVLGVVAALLAVVRVARAATGRLDRMATEPPSGGGAGRAGQHRSVPGGRGGRGHRGGRG